MKFSRLVAPALLAVPACLPAQFSTSGEAEVLTVAEIETALAGAGVTVGTTSSLEGVALGPGNTVHIVHSDAGSLTVAQIDLTSETALWTKTEADILSDLSLTGNLTLVGEFVYDPVNTRLVLGSDINAAAPGDPWTVFEIDTSASPYTASVILSSAGIQGWNSHDVTSAGTIVGALGEEYEVLTGNEPTTGYIDESGSATFVELFDVDDLKAATASGSGDEITGELPPETIGINPNDDTIYVFGHDNFELLSIAGITAGAPVDIEVNGWDDAATVPGSRVDLHGLEVDANDVVYGFDEAAESIVFWDGVDTASDVTGDITFADLESILGGGAFEVTVWRGMKARALSASQAELFLAPSNANYGLVRVLVDTGTAASVSEWQAYN